MSGGFGIVVGYLMAFVALMTLLFAGIDSYNSQLSEQSAILNKLDSSIKDNLNYNYNFIEPFYSSGKMNFLIENQGNSQYFKDTDSNLCFSFFKDNQYFSVSNYFMNILKPISYDYRLIDSNSYGVTSIKTFFDGSSSTYKSISCDGVEKTNVVSLNNIDWFDTSWNERKKITIINNNVNLDMIDYQVELDFNTSNLDFGLATESEIRFALPIKENFILDLPFDDYVQQILDYSKYSNTLYLGSTSSSEGSDPIQSTGIIFNGLYFDGSNDEVNINSDSSLEIKTGLSYSSWVKWDGDGNSAQNIFSNGPNNFLRIVNDGGVNDNKVLFQLDVNGLKQVYSSVTLDNSWHLVTGTFDGYNMSLYLDGVNVGSTIANGEISTFAGNNYIGSSGGGNYFKGNLDEFKVLDITLNPDEIQDLYYNNLRFRELDYYTSKWDTSTSTAKFFVKIPHISSSSNVTIHMYYDNRNPSITSISDIESTFSYDSPRVMGYIVSNRISGTTGLTIMSLYDSNTILVGSNTLSLNEQEGSTIGSGSLNQYDSVSSIFLAQIEGNNNGGDIIVPISWAGTEFYYRGFKNAADSFCMLSPWGTANVNIYDNGVSIYSGTVTSTGNCQSPAINTANNLAIVSDIPILVSTYGGTNDAFAFYPATSEELYGVPSANLYVGAGPLGANVDVYESSGALNSYSLGAYGTIADGGNGNTGNSNAFKIISDNFIGAIQQNDGNGAESSVFAPEKEMGVKFGSNAGTDYITIASPHSDANCSVYDSTGSIVANQLNGVGTNGVYSYKFGTGSTATYTNARWELKCDKPVWPYHQQNTRNDEINLLGHLQMRQYIYPLPSILID